jgi:hypothetical protein
MTRSLVKGPVGVSTPSLAGPPSWSFARVHGDPMAAYTHSPLNDIGSSPRAIVEDCCHLIDTINEPVARLDLRASRRPAAKPNRPVEALRKVHANENLRRHALGR